MVSGARAKVALVTTLAGGLFTTAVALLQTPTFEVASVRRNTSTSRNSFLSPQPGGRFTATNSPLVNLIGFAYGIPELRMVGVPDWVRQDRFDVVAKAEEDVSPDQARLMMRSLLAERFRLVVRTEQREKPILALAMERSDGSPGANLVKLSTPEDCKAAWAKPTTSSPGAAMVSRGCGGLSIVAGMASTEMGTIVIDRTGLTGTWFITLHYVPGRLTLPGGDAGQPSPEASGPSFTTALREQLGMKLESTRGPVDVLVIESIQQPTLD